MTLTCRNTKEGPITQVCNIRTHRHTIRSGVAHLRERMAERERISERMAAVAVQSMAAVAVRYLSSPTGEVYGCSHPDPRAPFPFHEYYMFFISLLGFSSVGCECTAWQDPPTRTKRGRSS